MKANTSPKDPPATLAALLERLKGGLIVSCQAEAGAPLHGAGHMAAMAKAAAAGGASGIRANGPDDIAAIRAAVNLPIIGIYKVDVSGFAVRITPTLEHAWQVAAAGADILAVDATRRPHPDHLGLAQRIEAIHRETGCLVMADIADLEDGLAAEKAGADLVATTLSGYTDYSPPQPGPDFELLGRLASVLKVPLVAEGRIATPEQAAQALELGAFAVVVGSAITRPQWITGQFVNGMKSSQGRRARTSPQRTQRNTKKTSTRH
jgi:N-acylglucosamine-6-phosphate 2-epimerase